MFDRKAYNAARYQAHKSELAKQRQSRKEDKAEYDAKYYNTHKVKKAKYSARWYLEHKEEAARHNAKWYKSHKKERDDYYRAHREEIAERAAEYRELHKTEIAQYQHEHLPEHAACIAKRRALKAGTLIKATPEQLEEIKDIYRKAREDPKVRCYICGKLIPLGEREVDHIIPVSKGGSSLPSNLAVAHTSCNRKKAARLPEDIGLLI